MDNPIITEIIVYSAFIVAAGFVAAAIISVNRTGCGGVGVSVLGGCSYDFREEI